jgi:hypothetical protein
MTSDTKKPRRQRADSKEAAVKDMLNGERTIAPPADITLTPSERLFFNEIIAELPKGEWTDHMIRLAAELARMMADARDETDAIRREGSVVEGAGGGPIRNPRCTQQSSLQASINATRRSLAIHSRAKGGMDTPAIARRRGIQRANEAFPMNDEDDLLARPPADFHNPRRDH